MKQFNSNFPQQFSIKKISETTFHAFGLIFSRIFSIAPNFSPIGSYGFLSGNIVSFFSSILFFDFFIGGTYRGSIFTYLGFLGYWVLGRFAKTQKRKLILLPFASFLFFLISNFGVWWYWYDHTINNLITCYLLAVPFYRNTLMSDVIFGYGYLVAIRLRKNNWGKTSLLSIHQTKNPSL